MKSEPFEFFGVICLGLLILNGLEKLSAVCRLTLIVVYFCWDRGHKIWVVHLNVIKLWLEFLDLFATGWNLAIVFGKICNGIEDEIKLLI